MSGRKSCEVLDLLSTGKKVRDSVLGPIYKNIEEYEKKNKEIENRLEELEKDLEMNRFNITKEMERKYSKEIQKIASMIEEIENWDYKKLIKNLDVEIERYKDILKSFNIFDNKAKELRGKIANKSWYCDSEYEEARKLVIELNSKKNELLSIEKIMSDSYRENSSLYEKGKSYKKLKENIERQIKNIEELILADNNKEQIEKEFKKINKADGLKFLQSKYMNLEKLVNEMINEKDNQKINQLSTEILSKIIDFNTEVCEKREEFDLKQQKALREYSELEKKIESFEFDDIEKKLYFEEEEKIGIQEFEKKYSRTNFSEVYLKGQKNIREEIENENFEKAFELLEKQRDLVNDFNRQMMNQYEKLLKEQELAAKISSAAYEMGYDINVNCIDDDLRNGYTVEAVAGDEIINFDRILVDEFGNTVIDLDHQESISGTCGNTMEKLLKSLRNEGVFITDITKNGKSVIYSSKKENKENKNEKEVSVR